MSNELTAEEETWMEELRAVAIKAAVPVPPRFWLASFAIVSKGDVTKGLQRMKNFQRAEEQYKLSECSEEAATEWFQKTFPQFYLGFGPSKSGRIGCAVRSCECDPSLIQTEQDWQYIAKTLMLTFKAANPTISHVRNGMTTVVVMTNMGLKNFSPRAEQRMAAIHQDAFPAKMKELYLVDPPTILKMILKFARLFIKKKVMDRVCYLRADEMMEHFDAASLPPLFGGSFDLDFFVQRASSLEQHRRSVEEMEGRKAQN